MYNIKVNHFSNVQAYNIALGKERTEETMVLPGSGPGGGSIDETIKGEYLAHHDGKTTIKVEVDALDNQIMLYRLPKPDLIKIDVEGLELDVLLGAKATIEKSKPKLLVEMHGADEEKKIKNIKNVMDLLISHQYSIWHVEKEVKITHINYQIGKEGHIYCT